MSLATNIYIEVYAWHSKLIKQSFIYTKALSLADPRDRYVRMGDSDAMLSSCMV
jgi:hypothetical protein